MKIVTFFLLLIALLGSGATRADDRFERIKTNLYDAACTEVGFLSILKSDIFDTEDTLEGTAWLAGDGRYYIAVGDDVYLFDGRCRYTYSRSNNQVVIERLDSSVTSSEEVTFLIRLDDYYTTQVLNPDTSYRLSRKPGDGPDIPDSMTVYLGEAGPAGSGEERPEIDRLEFYDINEDLNIIKLLHVRTVAECDRGHFMPAFPDSVERIKL